MNSKFCERRFRFCEAELHSILCCESWISSSFERAASSFKIRISFCSICSRESSRSSRESSRRVRNFSSEDFTLVAKVCWAFCSRCNSSFKRCNSVYNLFYSFCDCKDLNVSRERFTDDRKINRTRLRAKREAFKSISSDRILIAFVLISQSEKSRSSLTLRRTRRDICKKI